MEDDDQDSDIVVQISEHFKIKDISLTEIEELVRNICTRFNLAKADISIAVIDDDEISTWLLDADYRTAGAAEGGIGAVQDYYDRAPQILERRQLPARDALPSRTGEELLARTKLAVQR